MEKVELFISILNINLLSCIPLSALALSPFARRVKNLGSRHFKSGNLYMSSGWGVMKE